MTAGVLLESRGVLWVDNFFSHFPFGAFTCTLLYVVKNQQRPYATPIVIIHKSLAVCSGERWSWASSGYCMATSAQWTAPLVRNHCPTLPQTFVTEGLTKTKEPAQRIATYSLRRWKQPGDRSDMKSKPCHAWGGGGGTSWKFSRKANPPHQNPTSSSH